MLHLYWLALALPAALAPEGPPGDEETVIRYQADDSIFPNPERGFYASYVPPGGGTPGQQDTPHRPLQVAELRALRSRPEVITLIRDCILIPRRFWTEPISREYLQELQSNFDAVREAGLKTVPRFLYDWGMLNRDPDEAVILRHLDQLAPLLRRNADVIAWVQAGLFGGTGEGCRSDHGYVYPKYNGWQGLSEAGVRLYRRLLEVVPPDRMVTVRYPRLKWDLMGWGPGAARPLTAPGAFTADLSARLGYYSDGFMGDEHHYAMYQLPGEARYAAEDARFCVQEGEISDATAYKLQPHRVVADMTRHHQTALHCGGDGWNQVQAAWRNNGDYEEICRRMGWRFSLVEARLPARLRPGGAFTLRIVLTNSGFARAMNPRGVEVILRSQATGRRFVLRVDHGRGNRLWLPGPQQVKPLEIAGGLPADIPAGRYEVLLGLPDPYPSLCRRPEYSIRLANQGVWEVATGLNRLGHVLAVTSGAPGAAYAGKSFFAPQADAPGSR